MMSKEAEKSFTGDKLWSSSMEMSFWFVKLIDWLGSKDCEKTSHSLEKWNHYKVSDRQGCHVDKVDGGDKRLKDGGQSCL